MTTNILLTGSTGFIGRKLATTLHASPEVNLTAAVRRNVEVPAAKVVEVQSLDGNTDWSAALIGQQVVIHAAALVHIMNGKNTGLSEEFHRVNVDGTLNLARQAAASGVKRLIFVSSVVVNGTLSTRPFTEEDTPNFSGFYAQSKFNAELGLRDIGHQTGIEVVVIRPPMVYGANAPGNFNSLTKIVAKRWPLPFGLIHNNRSLIALDNLVDLIILCIHHPAAANQVFFAADGQDLSTTELLHGLSKAMGLPLRLIPVPESLLLLVATLVGKKPIAQRLLGSLQVDISKARTLLGWKPPVTVEEGLRRCFLSQNK